MPVHGPMLTPFAPDIWLADGPAITAAMGFRYPTRMALIRLAGGDLFIWSPVALCDALRAAVDALGPVRHIVAPNALHDSFLADWHRAYPEAALYAAPGLAAKRRDLAFAAELGDAAPPEWSGQIDQAAVAGNAITTEIVFFHRASATALFTDLLQQFPQGWFSGWRALVARLDLMTGPQPAVPRKFRLAFTNRRLARPALARILAWPATRVVMAHGTPVTGGGQVFLARAFAWLTR